MAFDLSTLTDYAWSDIAKAAKHAMVTAALGGENLIINGRTIGRISISDALELYNAATAVAEAEEAASGDSGGGTALVQFGERV
jgi:hypothetical protein